MFSENNLVGDADEEVFGKKLHKEGPQAYHCDVPLKYANVRLALNKPAPGQHVPRRNRPRSELREMEQLFGKINPRYHTLAHIQETLLWEFTAPENTVAIAEWKQQIRISNELHRLNFKALSEMADFQIYEDLTIEPNDFAVLMSLYLRKSFFEEAVLSSGSKTYRPSRWWRKINHITVYESESFRFACSQHLFFIDVYGCSYLTSRDHLLILNDLAQQRYILHLYAILENKLPTPNFLTPADLNRLLRCGDKMLHRGGDAAYKVIKLLEASCTGLLVGELPVGTANGRTFKELIRDETMTAARALEIEDLAIERLEFLEEFSDRPWLLSQIFGLYRLWGHPTLEPLEGVTSASFSATQVRLTNVGIASQITNKFKEELIMRYLKRYNKWPELDVSRLSPTNPIRCAYEVQGLYPHRDPEYNRKHLKLVKFGQLFPIDPKMDLAEFIADKAMSLDTDELIKRLKTGQGVGTSIDRSVLINWMKSQLGDPEVFLKYIDKYGFPIEERSVAVKEKERELKTEARLFGLMTLFKRFYIVLTEALIAEHVLPLFPEITMVDDEIELDRKRMQFTKKNPDQLSIITSMDFERWNLMMRELETIGVFQVLDQVFGFTTGVFTRTHEMFKSSSMYLLNGSYQPIPEGKGLKEGLGTWSGHLGGIEGLRQKGWTLWTVTLLLLAGEGLPMEMKLMGQGDNQVVKETYRPTTPLPRQMEVHYLFLKRLSDYLDKIGPRLKLEETWSSTIFFVYGKYMIYKGTPLPMSAKKLCRASAVSNEDFPTTESAISSLTANLSAAFASSPSIGSEFYIYLMELVRTYQMSLNSTYLLENSIRSVLSKPYRFKIPADQGVYYPRLPPLLCHIASQPDDIIIRLCFLPRCLGGYPVANIFNCVIRGFPDDLVFNISTLKLLYKVADKGLQEFIRSILNPQLMTTRNFKLLFEQPTALNLAMPPSTGDSRRNQIIDFLKTTERVKNVALKTFLRLLNNPEDKLLTEYLATAEPLNPRLLGEILGATIGARAQHLAGQLQRTKVIARLALMEGEQDIIKTIQQAEVNYMAGVLRICKGLAQGSCEWTPNKCSMSHAEELRLKSWGRPVVGVDCVPPQEFLYLETPTVMLTCPSMTEHDQGYILARVPTSTRDDALRDPYQLGPYNAYRGSVTKVKVTGYGDKLAKKADPLLAKVLKLHNLIGWGIPEDGHLSSLIQDLCLSRTDLDSKMLIPDKESISGSLQHRLRDMRTGHGGAVTILPNFGTKIVFDTFGLVEYNKGRKNVNLMFQSLFSIMEVLIAQALRFGWTSDLRIIHGHVKSSCCVRDIDETLVDCPNERPDCVRAYPDSPYLFISKDKLLPALTPEMLFPPSLAIASDAREIQIRLVWAVAEEMHSILTPIGWDLPGAVEGSKSLTLSWCFRLPLLETLEALALKIIATFLGSTLNLSAQDSLLLTAQKVRASSIAYWKGLINVLFSPGCPYDVASEPYFSPISGSPCLTPTIQANNIKMAVVTILNRWATDPLLAQERIPIEIRASPHVGLHQHPAYLGVIREWILNPEFAHPGRIRPSMFEFLNNRKEDIQIPQVYQDVFKEGLSCIMRESVDILAKKAPDYHPNIKEIENPQLKQFGFIVHDLLNFDGQDLEISEHDIIEENARFPRTYKTHRDKWTPTPTTGPYKITSILNELELANGGNYVCLGDGGGGFTYALLVRNSDNFVYFNTLVESVDQIQQAPPIPYIPSLSLNPSLKSRVFDLKGTNEGLDNFTHSAFPAYLRSLFPIPPIGILCDAEMPDYGQCESALAMYEKVFNICREVHPGWLILKAFIGNQSLCRAIISLALNTFHSVKVLRTEFSDIQNTEIYIYAFGDIVRSQIRVDKLHVTGALLKERHVPLLAAMRTMFREAASALTPEVLITYTNYLHPTAETAIFRQIMEILPFSGRNQIWIYPHSILLWISKVTPAPLIVVKRRGQLRGKSISFNLVKSWAIAWMTLYIAVHEPTDDETLALWDNGSALWYKLRNDHWEFSLTRKRTPWSPSVDDLMIWKLNKLILTRDMKVIQRTVGLMNAFLVKPAVYSGDESRGGLTQAGTLLPPLSLATNEWVRTEIQANNAQPVRGGTLHAERNLISALWRTYRRQILSKRRLQAQ